MNLPRLSRADRLLLSIALLLSVLVALVSWLFIPPEKSGGIDQQPSTFFNVAYGTKAAYQVLDRLAFPVTRLRLRIAPETLEGIGVLFILQPTVRLDDDEVAALEDWIKEGHALVVIPGSPGAPEASSAPEASGSPGLPGSPSAPAAHGHRLDAWFDLHNEAGTTAGQIRTHLAENRPARAERPAAGGSITAGIDELVGAAGSRFNRKSPLRGPLTRMSAETFWKDKLGTVGLRVKCGEGTIVALADPYPLSNLGIRDGDNGLLLANLARVLSDRSPGKIAFDEYHLGFPQRDLPPVAIAKLTLTGPWRWVVGQAVLLGIVALAGRCVRFGSPRDVAVKPRRQHREFAEAAGRLLYDARAVTVVAETLERHYRDRLCRLLHLEPLADDQRLGQAVRDRTGLEIGVAFEQVHNARSAPISRKRLLTLAQELQRVVERLDHGT